MRILDVRSAKGEEASTGYILLGMKGFEPRAAEVVVNETQPCRIAIVGDSHTFGENVAFEDTWGSVLESTPQGYCQVLNFGVGASYPVEGVLRKCICLCGA